MADARQAGAGRIIDLNADMGEGFGPYRLGDDAAMLDVVSSANVACGFHAGDPQIMATTFGLARDMEVAVGAHPGFPDLWGFGRRTMTFSQREIVHMVAYQVGAAQGMGRLCGVPVRYVKVHGALANMAETRHDVAAAILDGIESAGPGLPVLAIAHSALDGLCRERRRRCYSEIFADRAYDEHGHLLPRSHPGAVLHDPEDIARRAMRMVRGGYIETIGGRMVETRIDSICVHGDTPDAVGIARALRRHLESEGVIIRAFA
ncbi:LamB/YcsF family protein [Gluconacetobacter sp. Hr-1-5]|uniref:LamB/YcsF family protein n=1 Tax=Gluconacetobacter sp. Hr-1-5 TaxID=3395370 RepID=UPI003B52E70D